MLCLNMEFVWAANSNAKKQNEVVACKTNNSNYLLYIWPIQQMLLYAALYNVMFQIIKCCLINSKTLLHVHTKTAQEQIDINT